MRMMAGAALALLAIPTVAAADAPPPVPTEVTAANLATVLLPANARLKVSSPAFPAGGNIAFIYTQYQGNSFPGLKWSKGPAGTKSYAIVMQDPDGNVRGDPVLHWTMLNIPASVTSLETGMTSPPEGAIYGPNVRGPNMAYMGPRTPPGPKHRYHFQLFALDTMLPADPTLTFDAMKQAMTGHVLASGEVIGLGQVDPTAPPRK